MQDFGARDRCSHPGNQGKTEEVLSQHNHKKKFNTALVALWGKQMKYFVSEHFL